MTCKRVPTAHVLSVISLLIAIFAILIALVVPPQLRGAGQPSTKAAVIPSLQDANPPLFLPAVTYDSGGGLAWSVAVRDLNGDGKPDIVVVNYGVSTYGSVGVLLGNGDGTFQPVVTYGSGGSYASGMAIADVNNDGKPDVVVAHQGCQGVGSNCLGVLLGNGDGTLQPVATYADGGIDAFSGEGIFIPIMITDVNGDGKPDLLVASQTDKNYGDGLVGVLLGNGDGTFKPVVTYDSGGFAAFSAVLADVNGDGKSDLIVLNCGPSGSTDCPSNGGTVGVLLGNGDGTFQPVKTYSRGGVGGFFSPLTVADVNRDGKPDILVGNDCPGNCTGDGSFAVLLGNGDGTFQGPVSYDSGGGGVKAMAVADVNGNGTLDVVLAANAVGVWLGNGDGTFLPANIYAPSGNTGQVMLTDLNGDGKLDLVGINGTSSSADVRLGNGDGTFQELQTFALGGSQYSWATIADVNGDRTPDLVSANWCSSICSGEEGALGLLLNNAADTTPPLITVSATPKVLWPPNGKMIPVTVSGTITDSGSGVNVNSATYGVIDEYGEVQPKGDISLGPEGNYTFTILLQASRLGNDLDGRRYTITVRAEDNAGNKGSKTSAVTVPHDQRD